MDFHGNNVHHIGYGHPRLKRAIAEQMDALPFAPRRYACEPAVALAEKLAAIAPGDLSKVLFTTGGSDAVEVAVKIARAATGRFKTLSFWDAFHGAGFGAGGAVGRGAVPLRRRRRRWCRAPSMSRPSAAIAAPTATSSHRRRAREACARMIDYVLDARRRRRGVHRRADARGALRAAARLLAQRARRLRPPRHAPDLRRDPDRPRQDRHDVRLRARRRGARHPGARQGARRRHPADRGRDRAARAGRRRRLGLRPLHAREEPGDGARGADHHRDHRGRGAASRTPPASARSRSSGCAT